MDSRTTDAQTAEKRIPELDGLRGIAILLVLLIHFFYNPGAGMSWPVRAIGKVATLGWSGVDLFFVLSGFLIGGILMDHMDSGSYFRTFYARRAFRILPVYYLWILLYLGVIWFGGEYLRQHTHSGQSPEVDFSIYRHFFFLQNVWNVEYVSIAYWWFGPLWSLAVEEQFYLVVPLLVRYLPMRRLPAVLWSVVLAAMALRLAGRMIGMNPTYWDAYRMTPCRADALAIGMLVAYFWRRRDVRERILEQRGKLYGMLGVLCAGVLVIWWRAPLPSAAGTQVLGFTWIAMFYAALLVTGIALKQGPVARVLRWRVLREFGRVSYCLYLIHSAVGFLCFEILLRSGVRFSDLRSGLVGVLSIAVAYGIARISWEYVEAPLVRRGHRFRY